jgi:hypothetical protein
MKALVKFNVNILLTILYKYENQASMKLKDSAKARYDTSETTIYGVCVYF